MPISNIFAKRKRAAENAEKPVIYTQNDLPEQFRTQVVWIFRHLIGFPNEGYGGSFFDGPSTQFWQQARDTLAAELGRFYLVLQSHLNRECLKASLVMGLQGSGLMPSSPP